MALVITRGIGQSFTIGKDIKITIIRNKKSTSRAACLLIDAPKELAIIRDDIKKVTRGT